MYIPIGLENSPYRSLCGSNLLMEVSSIKLPKYVVKQFEIIALKVYLISQKQIVFNNNLT